MRSKWQEVPVGGRSESVRVADSFLLLTTTQTSGLLGLGHCRLPFAALSICGHSFPDPCIGLPPAAQYLCELNRE